jgi:hypothetical protein
MLERWLLMCDDGSPRHRPRRFLALAKQLDREAKRLGPKREQQLRERVTKKLGLE